MQVTSFDIVRELDLQSSTPCNFMSYSLVKLMTTPIQIPEAPQGLLHFEGSMEQYSGGANRVLIPISDLINNKAMRRYVYCRPQCETFQEYYSPPLHEHLCIYHVRIPL